MGAALKLHDVRLARGGRDVLRVDDLTVAAGEHVSVLGPNGAGKTTLLRLLAGVDRPDSGRVTLDGASPAHDGVEVRRRVAYATQQAGLLGTTALRNVELPLRWRKIPRRQRTRTAMAALERLRVAHLADRPARELSGGEQQRVNLARALALDPAVLLLDEPASGLDAQTRGTFFADLEAALADRATTVVQVSHRADEAMQFANRVVVLVDGRMHQVDAPDDLSLRPADSTVAALIGYHNLVPAVVDADGAVRVDGARTGLALPPPAGPVTAAVFARGVLLSEDTGKGLRLRVQRVTPSPGHRVVTLGGTVPLIAHLPVGVPAPLPGDVMGVRFDPALSAILPGSDERLSAAPRPADAVGPLSSPAS